MTKLSHGWEAVELLDDLGDLPGDLDLIERVRVTGTLHSEALADAGIDGGERRPWYNPAVFLAVERENAGEYERLRKQRELREEHGKRKQLAMLEARRAALESWRAHQAEVAEHMRMAHRYAEMLRAG